MVPSSLTRRLLCAGCLRVYVECDEEQRETGFPIRGINALADRLTVQVKTAKIHARHLQAAGIIGLEPNPEKGDGWGEVRFRVLHNPARGRFGELRPTAEFPEALPNRWRRPKNKAFLEAAEKTNGERDAPPVGEDREEAGSATRPPFVPDEELTNVGSATRPPFVGDGRSGEEARGASRRERRRDAPRVPSSETRSEGEVGRDASSAGVPAREGARGSSNEESQAENPNSAPVGFVDDDLFEVDPFKDDPFEDDEIVACRVCGGPTTSHRGRCESCVGQGREAPWGGAGRRAPTGRERRWAASCEDSFANAEYRRRMREAVEAYRRVVPRFFDPDEALA